MKEMLQPVPHPGPRQDCQKLYLHPGHGLDFSRQPWFNLSAGGNSGQNFLCQEPDLLCILVEPEIPILKSKGHGTNHPRADPSIAGCGELGPGVCRRPAKQGILQGVRGQPVEDARPDFLNHKSEQSNQQQRRPCENQGQRVTRQPWENGDK